MLIYNKIIGMKVKKGDEIMSKRVYISADYSENRGDRDVVETLTKWGKDNLRIVDFVDMAQVVSGSVSKDPDCRPCDLKQEFNRQINLSSAVIFVVGDKTASRTAGSSCSRKESNSCTPYKQNANGSKMCKFTSTTSAGDDVGNINSYSYLRHEFEQAKKREKSIIVLYNSLYKQSNWLPSYMKNYESDAIPFWTNSSDEKNGDYVSIKKALGYA